MIKSISLPNIPKVSNIEHCSFNIKRSDSLNYLSKLKSYKEPTNTKHINNYKGSVLPVQTYIDSNNINCEYVLSSDGKYLISYSFANIINKITIFNIKKHITEFKNDYLNHKVIACSPNAKYILCGRVFSKKIKEIILIKINNKYNKNTLLNEKWQQNIKRYSSLPASNIATVTINNKAILANYEGDKLNIWYEGGLVEQRFIGDLFSRKAVSWKLAPPIKIDAKISNIKFDNYNPNRLFVLTKNETLQLFYRNMDNLELWDKKHSLINCVSFPDIINDAGDIMLFFKGKSLTTRRYTSENIWHIDTVVLEEDIKDVVFLPKETTKFLIYSEKNMYNCDLDKSADEHKWIISKEPTQLQHSVLRVLASANNESNIIIYNSKQEQNITSNKCTIS